MRNAGLSAEAAKAGADAAMEHFAHWRSRRCPQETHDTLAKLAKVAAGGDYQMATPARNCSVLSDYFRFVLRAGRMAVTQTVCRHVPPCGGASECAARADSASAMI